jgi:hypothetical protein
MSGRVRTHHILSAALFVAFPAVGCSGEPGTQSASTEVTQSQAAASTVPEEGAEIHAFLDSRYKSTDVRHSFVTAAGETIDCVDFFAEPGVRAMAARGEPIATIPTFELPPDVPPKGTGGTKSIQLPLDGSLDPSGQIRACPAGSVPELRLTPERILAAGGLAPFLHAMHHKAPPPILPPPANESPGFAHVLAVASNVTVAWATASFSVASPAASPTQHSLAQIWFGAGNKFAPCDGCACTGPGCFETIEVGWNVDHHQGMYSDYDPHLFIYSTEDGYGMTGCYNNMGNGCPTWIPNPSSWYFPGMDLAGLDPSYADFPPQYDLNITVGYRYSAGWQVTMCIDAQYCSTLGYYALSDYSAPLNASPGYAHGTFFNAGGEVEDDGLLNRGSLCGFGLPPIVTMGQGLYNAGGGATAYFHDYYYLTAQNSSGRYVYMGAPISTCPTSYAWTNYVGQNDFSPWANSFFYGNNYGNVPY